MVDSLLVDSTMHVHSMAGDGVYVSQAFMDSMAATQHTIAMLQQKVALSEKAAFENNFKIDNLWMMIASALVFIMNLGFATLESGLTTAKNTINVLFKNTIIPC